MAWVTLVRVDTTVSTVCATTGFLENTENEANVTHTAWENTYGSLLDNNALDEEVLELDVFRIRVRLSVLEETENKLHGLLRPATL